MSHVSDDLHDAAQVFWRATYEMGELPFLPGSERATDVFRRKYCAFTLDELLKVKLRFEDLPTDSLQAVEEKVHPLLMACHDDSPGTVLYNLFIEKYEDAYHERGTLPLSDREMEILIGWVREAMAPLDTQERLVLATDLIDHDQWSEEILKYFGEERGDQLLKKMALGLTIPACQAVLDEFTADSAACHFTGDAAAKQQEILNAMQVSLGLLKHTVSASRASGRGR